MIIVDVGPLPLAVQVYGQDCGPSEPTKYSMSMIGEPVVSTVAEVDVLVAALGRLRKLMVEEAAKS